mgnify:CR=1 FL=1
MNRFVTDKGMHVRHIHRKNTRGSLVFVHGLGESGLCAEPLGHAMNSGDLLKDWDLWIPDLPGYGCSLHRSPPLSLVAQAGCIREIIENVQPSPVVIMGHSMGGVIGQIISEMHDVSLTGFINIEGNLTAGDCVFSGQAASVPLSEFVATGFDRLKSCVFENGIRFPAQRGYYASMRFANPEQFHQNSRELLEYSSPGTAAERFAALQFPTLYIAGQPHGICPESLRQLAQHAVTPAIIQDAGHWPFLDQPGTFYRIITRFLSTISLP